MQFSPIRDPSFSCNYARVLKSKYLDEEIL